jgi:hypothetical protein
MLRRALLCALLCSPGACGPPAPAAVSGPLPTLLVSVGTGSVTAPDTVEAGWTRVRVEEDGKGHILVFFRMADRVTAADESTFVAALDTARTTPLPAVAIGGPEIGDTGEVVLQLSAGRYVLGCVARGPDNHRHAGTGEAASLVVTSSAPQSGRGTAAPAATQDVGMVDFAYVGPERWPAGTHLLRVENRGKQDHQLRLVRLREGTTVQDWLSAERPGRLATPIAGVARMGPGGVAYLAVDLGRGTYVMSCLIADPASGRAHAELGMFRPIRVE